MKLIVRIAFLTAFLLFGFIMQTYSQIQLESGYIIDNHDDTIYGKVEVIKRSHNPGKITFLTASGEKQMFFPTQIKAFSVPGKEYYISRHVSMNLTSLQIAYVYDMQPVKIIPDTLVFLSVIVKGKSSLYSFQDANDREHFYLEKGSDMLVELKISKSLQTKKDKYGNSKSYIVTTELFKGQMIVMYSDCPDLKDVINKSAYRHSSLRSLVIRYNKCQGDSSSFKEHFEKKVKFGFGPFAGVSLTNFQMKGEWDPEPDNYTNQNYLSKFPDFPVDYTYNLGVELNIIFSMGKSNIIIVNQLAYKPWSTAGDIQIGSTIPAAVVYNKYSFYFDFSYLRLYTLLRYEYAGFKVKPFADLGISNSYAIKSVNTVTIDKQYFSKVTTISQDVFPDIYKYEIGLVMGAGAAFHGLECEFRFELSNGISGDNGSAAIKSYYFNVGWLF